MALTSITKDFVVRSGITSEGTNWVTSSTGMTATLQVNGGAAIAKNLIVGTTATIWGPTTLQNNLTVNGSTVLGNLTATLTTVTSLQVTGPSLFQGQTLFTGAVNTFSGSLFVTGTNIFTVGTGTSNFGGNVNIAGIASVTNNTTANSGGATGALVVTGGTYIGDNLVVKSTAWNTATNTANAIYTPGGIYADQGLTVSGPVLFKDIVTFNGTATYVLSTNTFYTDNLIELHTPPGGVYTPWFVDDGKDIGFRFHYYTNSTDTNAALVLDNSSKELHWYGSGAEDTGGNFGSATYGIFRTGSIRLNDSTGVHSTTTGALQVKGGVGVGGNMYVGGVITATTFVGALSGTATTADNLSGGLSGSLPYQTAAGATTMLAIGTNGYILQVVGGNPTWTPVSGLTSGLASTATNIAGGLKDQIPYQTAPGQTAFNAGMTFNGTIFTATNITVSGTSNSTGYNNNTGALIVRGGAAINNDLWVGGDINLQGSLYLKGVGLDQITGSTGTFDFIIVEGTGTSLVVTDGSTFGGITTVTNATPSLGAAGTGALQVRGGIGITKDIYVGTTATVAGILNVTNTSPSLGAGSVGSIETAGGVGIAKDLDVGTTATISGITFHNNTTPTLASATQGAVQTTGGVGIAKDIYVGTTATVAGTLFATSTSPALGGGANTAAVEVTGGVEIAKDIYVGTTATIVGSASVGAAFTVTGFTSLNGGALATAMTITNSTSVNSTGTGALIVPFGGVGIGGGLVVGGVTSSTNTAPSLGVAGAGSVQTAGGVGIAKDIYVGTTATIAGVTFHNNTTPTLASASQGAVQTTGGVGIAKDIYVGTTATIAGVTFHNNTTPTLASASQGAIQTTGGVGIAKDLYVGTTATVAGILTVNNNTSVSSTTTGALQITNGGLAVGGGGFFGGTVTATNLVVTGSATLPGNISLSALTVTNLTVTNNETVGNNLSVANLFTATGASTFGNTIAVTGIASFNNTADSNATNNGSIVTAGGVGIAKNLVVGSAVTIGSATTQTVVTAVYSNNFLDASYTSGYISAPTQATLDTYSATTYRTAKYLIQIVDASKIHVEEILLFHDGTNVYMTEYGVMSNTGELGDFDATLAANTITLKFTPNYTPTLMTIKVVRTTITL
jgi:hypothetical protein